MARASGYLALVTLVRDQGLFLEEWIEYHRIQGFEKIIIFDHASQDNTLEILQPYIDSDLVIFIPASQMFPEACPAIVHGPHRQGGCQFFIFDFTTRVLKHRYRWLGIFDVDEFIRPVKTDKTFLDYLPDYEGYHVLHFHAVVFGNSRLQELPTNHTGNHYPLVIEHNILRPRVKDSAYSPHYQHRFGRKSVTHPARAYFYHMHSSHCPLMTCFEKQFQALDPLLRMNHYQYKSIQDQNRKADMNGNDVLAVNEERDEIYNEILDTSIHHLVPKVKSNIEYVRKYHKPKPL